MYTSEREICFVRRESFALLFCVEAAFRKLGVAAL